MLQCPMKQNVKIIEGENHYKILETSFGEATTATVFF